MKSLLSFFFAALLFTLAGPAQAGADSGTIAFTGTITNGSCGLDLARNFVMLECYDPASGRTVVRTADIMHSKTLTDLPIEVKMHWLTPEKNKGIIDVSYL